MPYDNHEDQMMGDNDIKAKLQVLDEIKELMDSRLGNALSGNGDVSIEKVSVSKDDDVSEDMSEEDKQKLVSMYSGL